MSRAFHAMRLSRFVRFTAHAAAPPSFSWDWPDSRYHLSQQISAVRSALSATMAMNMQRLHFMLLVFMR